MPQTRLLGRGFKQCVQIVILFYCNTKQTIFTRPFPCGFSHSSFPAQPPLVGAGFGPSVHSFRVQVPAFSRVSVPSLSIGQLLRRGFPAHTLILLTLLYNQPNSISCIILLYYNCSNRIWKGRYLLVGSRFHQACISHCLACTRRKMFPFAVNA